MAHRLRRCICAALSVLGAAVVLESRTALGPVVASQTSRRLPPLEAFSNRPDAKLTWSAAVGLLETPKARATFAAVAYEDRTATPSTMRGLRIALEHLVVQPDCWDRFSNNLCFVSNPVLMIEEAAIADARATAIAGNWRNLNFSFGGASSGVILGGFIFDGKTIQDVVSLIDQATAELAKAPR